MARAPLLLLAHASTSFAFLAGDASISLGGSHGLRRAVSPRAATAPDEEVDVVVIGSGLGGLSCASLLASRGLKVSVLEAHYELGGCCHEFNVGLDGRTIPTAALAKQPDTPVFKFEAGPSLYSGLSLSASPNPLKHIFQMVEEEPEWLTYDTWGAHLPEVPEGYELSIGAENFLEILRRSVLCVGLVAITLCLDMMFARARGLSRPSCWVLPATPAACLLTQVWGPNGARGLGETRD